MSWLSANLSFENLPSHPPSDPETETEAKRYERREVVAEWRIPLQGKLYRIEFEHGTTTGRRVIWVNAEEVLRREWMFKLVGEDFFNIGSVRCIIRVDPAPGFKYNYLLFVDGKPFKQFTEKQAKALKSWVATFNGNEYRVVLEKDSMNIFLNGKLREEVGDFVDGGTDTEFKEEDLHFLLKARANGNKHDSFTHTLFVNGVLVPEEKII